MPNGTVTIAWGDGEHEFNVAKIKCALELEEKCNAGLAEICSRLYGRSLSEQRWRINDIRETLRIGLIGGGKSPVEALRLVQRYCDDRPLAESVTAALTVVMAAIVGVTGDQPGKPEADQAATELPSTQTKGDLSDPQYMASAKVSDGIPAKRTRRRSGNSPRASKGTTEPKAQSSSPHP